MGVLKKNNCPIAAHPPLDSPRQDHNSFDTSQVAEKDLSHAYDVLICFISAFVMARLLTESVYRSMDPEKISTHVITLILFILSFAYSFRVIYSPMPKNNCSIAAHPPLDSPRQDHNSSDTSQVNWEALGSSTAVLLCILSAFVVAGYLTESVYRSMNPEKISTDVITLILFISSFALFFCNLYSQLPP